MSRLSNPRELSDESLTILLEHAMCPMCLGKLDPEWICVECRYPASEFRERAAAAGPEHLDHVEVSNE